MNWKDAYQVLTEDLTPPMKRFLLHLVLFAVLFLHVAWACGWIPNVPGFALASDTDEILKVQREMEKDWDGKLDELKASLDDLADNVHTMRVEMLEERILMLRSARCQAEGTNNREQYSRRLQRALRQYRTLTNTAYPLEACD